MVIIYVFKVKTFDLFLLYTVFLKILFYGVDIMFRILITMGLYISHSMVINVACNWGQSVHYLPTPSGPANVLAKLLTKTVYVQHTVSLDCYGAL